MHPLLRKLDGTDRRSIGRVDEVVADVLAKPRLFGIVFDGMLHNNPVVRMRCADAVEKITCRHPEYLLPYKKKLIETRRSSLKRLRMSNSKRSGGIRLNSFHGWP
jgi:hypothetical protein